MMSKNQDRLLTGLKNGDKSIFEELYREYYTPLCFYCMRYLDNDEDSEEIVQDLFVKLWEKHEELEVNTSLNAYLYRAVQNYAFNHLSKKKTREKYQLYQKHQIHNNFESGQNKLEEEELRVIVKKAILELPEKRREIFELSRYEGMRNAKIAEKLSISIKTVETQMTKALKYLRIVLKEYTPE